MGNTKVVDDVLSEMGAFSDEGGPQWTRISREEMIRLSKERGEIIGSVSDATSAIIFFH
jgi:hypothetical protein